jgi:hypothetical protein
MVANELTRIAHLNLIIDGRLERHQRQHKAVHATLIEGSRGGIG